MGKLKDDYQISMNLQTGGIQLYKRVLVIIAYFFLLCLIPLSGCNSGESSEDLISGSWLVMGDDDIYTFETDGTGSISFLDWDDESYYLTYSIDDGIIMINSYEAYGEEVFEFTIEGDVLSLSIPGKNGEMLLDRFER